MGAQSPAAQPPPPRRRRRRGSLERPLNGRLYRSAFLVLSLPLLIAAFSVVRPGPLPAPLLPPAFDGTATKNLAAELSSAYPSRVPGSPDAIKAAQWFRNAMRPYGLPVESDSWEQRVPGVGTLKLQNLWAVAPGQSPDAIVVLAHRDDTGAGPGANDDASGTAALIELARTYAGPATTNEQRVRAAHTIVFLSTDGGAYGGLGAARFAARAPFKVVAAINLDAIAGGQPPRIVITGDQPRSPAATLVETASRRLLEQTGKRVRRAGFFDQLVDLAFPFTLYEQGPFVADGVPAVTITSAGDRPPAAFGDDPTRLDGDELAAVGRATQELIGSLDQGIDLSQGTTSFVWVGDRVVRGWAIELVLIALLIPFLVAAVDLFAHCRRRRIPLLPALRSLRSRLSCWLFVGVAFYLFGFAGAWPAGARRPPNPALPATGHWPIVALILFAVVAFIGWVVSRQRLIRRRVVSHEEELAGQTVALLALAVVSLLVLATNPYALLFALPPLHAWLWLPQLRDRRPELRAAALLVGLAGPAIVVASLAVRYHLGFDAPWYVLELVGLGYISPVAVAITLAGGAAGAQLVSVAAGRYAPYPERGRRPTRGPLREFVRSVTLVVRSRRQAGEQRRRAVG
jgi:hypothetical protein